MRYDWLIVGASFTGCVLAERFASQLGQRVLLIDSRNHLGGNSYDEYDEHGILVGEKAKGLAAAGARLQTQQLFVLAATSPARSPF